MDKIRKVWQGVDLSAIMQIPKKTARTISLLKKFTYWIIRVNAGVNNVEAFAAMTLSLSRAAQADVKIGLFHIQLARKNNLSRE